MKHTHSSGSLPKSFLTPVTSASSFICEMIAFSSTGASWGRGDMQGVRSMNEHDAVYTPRLRMGFFLHLQAKDNLDVTRVALIFPTQGRKFWKKKIVLSIFYFLPTGVLLGTFSNSCTIFISNNSNDRRSWNKQKTCRKCECCSADNWSLHSRFSLDVSECAPVQSAGRLRGSRSPHGSRLQTSRGRCPWILPPSPSLQASPPPSAAHTRTPSWESLQCALKGEFHR